MLAQLTTAHPMDYIDRCERNQPRHTTTHNLRVQTNSPEAQKFLNIVKEQA